GTHSLDRAEDLGRPQLGRLTQAGAPADWRRQRSSGEAVCKHPLTIVMGPATEVAANGTGLGNVAAVLAARMREVAIVPGAALAAIPAIARREAVVRLP